MKLLKRKMYFLFIGTLVLTCPFTSLAADKPSTEFRFRSYGYDFFTYVSADKKIYRCDGLCSEMARLSRDTKIEFLDGFKIVEFEVSDNPRSCQVTNCHEILK